MERTGNLDTRKVSPDLQEERSKLAFDQLELRHAIYFNEQHYNRYVKMNETMNLEGSGNTYDFWELSREEMQEELWRRVHNLWQDPDRRKKVYTEFDSFVFPYYQPSGFMQSASQPLGMHLICGPATVKFLGSEEQQQIWYPKFVNYEIVTCYAQTELGHGSDVSGIETTATYEVAS